jgi:hypothetical protein
LEVFGSYLASCVSGSVLFKAGADGIEVIYGDSGIMVAPDRSVFVRSYQDNPFPADAQVPDPALVGQLGADFIDRLAEHHASNTFVTPLLFPSENLKM